MKFDNLEENNPMFLMSVPKPLRKSRDVLDILRENAARLQTPYDIRATLLDIIKVPAAAKKNGTISFAVCELNSREA
ncbi:hypothetical protein TELCIR_14402 [Teladorsagia circumcincta]|uniref:Uncharacterized protein n=1 Tax=Teladorsagia circumcincta TaxID=45464 RepID=A0A2G9U183_TELCI|nr:hypothetical protein TELCIR_14402 [Teladorsagia circumcincta]